jgi:phospholipid/cholesterol/gamma-HCH transport system permease protein
MNLGALEHFGKFILWLPQIFSKPENHRMYYKETIRQMYDIGIGSLFIVFLISIFIGAVTAIQFSYQLAGTLIPRYYIGYIVRDMTIIELAATITCLVLAGKVGSNIAAEIGGMRQKEHIDAMEIMGVNTAAYLVMPKLIAAVLVIPILVSVAAIVSIAGGYIASVPTGIFTDAEYVKGLRSFFDSWNVVMMYVKAVVFAAILVCVSCYQGYFVKGGSIELGQASTRAVVFSNILILLADYLIAVVLTA